MYVISLLGMHNYTIYQQFMVILTSSVTIFNFLPPRFS